MPVVGVRVSFRPINRVQVNTRGLADICATTFPKRARLLLHILQQHLIFIVVKGEPIGQRPV